MYDPGGSVTCGALYVKFRVWCEQNGTDLLKQAPNSQSLGRLLRNRVVGFRQAVTTFREHEGQREYLGIRLKTKAELAEEP
jgi:hypothetical protein